MASEKNTSDPACQCQRLGWELPRQPCPPGSSGVQAVRQTAKEPRPLPHQQQSTTRAERSRGFWKGVCKSKTFHEADSLLSGWLPVGTKHGDEPTGKSRIHRHPTTNGVRGLKIVVGERGQERQSQPLSC